MWMPGIHELVMVFKETLLHGIGFDGEPSQYLPILKKSYCSAGVSYSSVYPAFATPIFPYLTADFLPPSISDIAETP
jgi:hypothetical protein